jgi:hypothetical protein
MIDMRKAEKFLAMAYQEIDECIDWEISKGGTKEGEAYLHHLIENVKHIKEKMGMQGDMHDHTMSTSHNPY